MKIQEFIKDLNRAEIRQLKYLLGVMGYRDVYKYAKTEVEKVLDETDVSVYFADTSEYIIVSLVAFKNKATDWVLPVNKFDKDDKLSILKYVLTKEEIGNFFSLFNQEDYEKIKIGDIISRPFAGDIYTYEVTRKEPLKNKREEESYAYRFYLSSGKYGEQILEARFVFNGVTGRIDRWVQIKDKNNN